MIYLTIIIPHYNAVQPLELLLVSIPFTEQVEIIIVDDRSDINELEHLQRIISNSKHQNIHLLKNNTKHKGAGICRNIGIENAKGQWLLFADADDYFIEGFFDTISVYFKSENDVIFFSPTSIDIQSQLQSDRHLIYQKRISDYLEKADEISLILLKYSFKVPWSKLIRTSFLREYKIYFDEVLASNDVMFSTKVGYHMRAFEASREEIYCVTERSGTLTKNTSKEVFACRRDVYIAYCNYLKERLPKHELTILDLHGRYILSNALLYRIGLMETLVTFFKLRRNKIKVFDLWLLNPRKVSKRILEKLKAHNKNKKFLQ
ncbi:glycosyltransferase involved in cell wall biosynthesis [Natronobacillus azotifigens]|uniref:Glycosyltransferase family 2 protein n=1 Tax=Natronobacillus azotifigens TaxID=472978 RepID=A0A9J6REC3_9BACI|nr:glycosyltransferase family 2 protein [Natronobacillus azotifigens]MCZ0703691.1 glycosyltransferase family 2 protein [Natronobacillus azotifigens]